MTAVIHICSDSSVLLFDSVYSEVLTAPKNKPQKCNSSYKKTVVYATTQMFVLGGHSGSIPQWSTYDWWWMIETRADFLKVQTFLPFQLSATHCFIFPLYRCYLL